MNPGRGKSERSEKTPALPQLAFPHAATPTTPPTPRYAARPKPQPRPGKPHPSARNRMTPAPSTNPSCDAGSKSRCLRSQVESKQDANPRGGDSRESAAHAHNRSGHFGSHRGILAKRTGAASDSDAQQTTRYAAPGIPPRDGLTEGCDYRAFESEPDPDTAHSPAADTARDAPDRARTVAKAAALHRAAI